MAEPTTTTTTTPIPPPIAQTPLCIIRPYHASDVPVFQRHADDVDVSRYMTSMFSYPYTMEAAQRWYTFATTMPPPLLVYAICIPNPEFSPSSTSSSHSPVPVVPEYVCAGGIGLKLPTPETPALSATEMEVGYWIGKAFWGRGIATHALAAFSSWAFETFPALQRLEAQVMDPNLASGPVLLRAGWTFVETCRGRPGDVDRHGDPVDMRVYHLERADAAGALRAVLARGKPKVKDGELVGGAGAS